MQGLTTTNDQGETITHTYENGQLVSSTNESTGETITYDRDGNEAILTMSDGTVLTVELGEDGLFGTADDVMIGWSNDQVIEEYDDLGRITRIIDQVNGTTTIFTYSDDGLIATIETYQTATGQLVNRSILDLVDGILGNGNDIYREVSGFQCFDECYFFTETFDAQVHPLRARLQSGSRRRPIAP